VDWKQVSTIKLLRDNKNCIDIDQSHILKIKVRENWRDNQGWTIQINWQHWVYKTQDDDKQNKEPNTICVGYHYAQTNKNNANKTWAFR